jgi:gliding motility-associated-like protein
MLKRAKFIVLILVMFVAEQMFGSHVVGGEMNYTYLGNNEYALSLAVYRDCSNAANSEYDNPAVIGIHTATGTLVQYVSIDFVAEEVISMPVSSNNNCFDAPSGICVEKFLYQDTVTLPPLAGGYTLTYQRCCRNFTILNIETGTSVGISITTSIPGPELAEINSNPVFNSFPPLVICLGQPFTFNHSATDSDGDVLEYSFCTPVINSTSGSYITTPGPPPYDPVTYTSGYSYNDPISSVTPFAIDPITGVITGTPNLLGQYVVGICVTEYRNGVPINVTQRDFQFNVTTCSPVPPPAINTDQTVICSGDPLVIQNDSPTDMDYFWDFGDLTTLADTSNLFEPTYQYPGPGSYTVTLIMNRGMSCADTTSAVFQTTAPINPSVASQVFSCANGIVSYDFNGSGGNTAAAAYSWAFGANATPATSVDHNPQDVVFTQGANATVVLTISESGCTEHDTVTFAVPLLPVAAIEPQSTFCDGYTYQFHSLSENATSYHWDFGAPGTGDVAASENPTYTYPDTALYTVELIVSAPNLCPDTAYAQMLIYGLLQPGFLENDAQCFEGNSFNFYGFGSSTDEAIYTWNFGSNAFPQTATTAEPQSISFNTPGAYEISLTIAENDCLETYTDSVYVFANPEFSAAVDSIAECSSVTAQFVNTSSADTPMTVLWDFGDGTTSNENSPYHTYTQYGTFDVSLQVSTTSGCIDSDEFYFPGLVQVYAPPVAGFTVDNNEVDILDPAVQFTSTAIGAVGCEYIMGDGGIVNDCDFTYNFSQTGVITVEQTVVNQVGCTDRTTGTIFVNGFSFWAPNSFTPDNDGVNDVWMPVVLGATYYDLKIYDRWGDAIFTTNDVTKGWIGQVHNGEHYAQEDVYQYTVLVYDLLSLPHEYKGHICVVR